MAASAGVPDNCHTVLVTNPSTTVTVLVGIATPPAPLTAGVNAQPVAPGATLTLGIGTQALRGAITLAYDSVGGAVTASICYINQFGSP